jgi:hypothetical protein
MRDISRLCWSSLVGLTGRHAAIPRMRLYNALAQNNAGAGRCQSFVTTVVFRLSDDDKNHQVWVVVVLYYCSSMCGSRVSEHAAH